MKPNGDFAAVAIRLAAALAGTSSLKEGLRLCLKAALSASGLDSGGIYVLDPTSRTLRLEVHMGVTPAFGRSQKRQLVGVPYYAAVMRGRPIYFRGPDSLAKTNIPASHAVRSEGLKTAAIIPVLAHKRVVACLNLASHTRGTIPASSRRALTAVAAQIGQALLRLQAETAVRQSEEKYRKLFNDADHAVGLADAETGLLLDANAKMAEISGYSVKELRGMHQSRIHPPAETAKYGKMFQSRIRRGTSVATRGLIHRKDGRDVPVEISSSLIRWGGRRMLLGYFRDMTEHNRAEKRQARSRAELRRMASRLAEIQENERRRIACELHDDVGQEMAGLALALKKLRHDMPAGHRAGARLNTSIRRLEELTGRIRAVIADLRPPLLDDYGLPATLEWIAGEFSRRGGVPVKTWIEEDIPRLPSLAEIALVRIAGEALANIRRHARATQVVLSLEADKDKIRLMVKDDGVGFGLEKTRRAAASRHWGLSIMKERAEGAGGRFRIDSAPGKGTQILVEVPR
ncbi:MAG: PAS domain S-box protein [Acidobacteriota bacterium]|nr:PAS domain S-box protein [Acidobacteriota bacterium]